LIITLYAIPVFNTVFETNVAPKYFLNLKVVASIITVLFGIGSLVVVLSVLRQWSIVPINLMARDSSKVKFSKALFTLQFTISITLAICAVTIVQQMNYVENAPLGFNRHIIQVNAPDKKASNALTVLKQKVIQLPDVHTATISSGNPIFGNMIVRYEVDNGQFYSPYLFGGDEDYLKTLGLKLVEGQMPSEKNNGKLVNQTLVRQFNLAKAVGEQIPGTKDVIVGVVEDFTCGSFKQEIPPAIISFHKEGQSLLIGYEGSDLSTILPQIQTAWTSVFPDRTFSYRLIQDELMKKYKEDNFFYKIIVAFSVISMVLSCFGLFALSWAVVQSRTKEIGIRKIVGATPANILNLLTMTFTKRIVIAFAIAAPVGYYLMDEWLMRFANKIELNAWIFGVSGLMVIIVAVVTLSLQTLKATLVNPIDEIRNE
jgi:putative ABC transport system permease protein